MTVARWTSWGQAQRDGLQMSIGGMGGNMDGFGSWAEYVDGCDERTRPYAEALRAEIVARGIRWGGDWHQEYDDGCPVFSDGTCGQFSYRAWGDLLAAVWAEVDGRRYMYMDFYMRTPGEMDRRLGVASAAEGAS